jgi:tetratricopeptide (TPR) repeat protein
MSGDHPDPDTLRRIARLLGGDASGPVGPEAPEPRTVPERPPERPRVAPAGTPPDIPGYTDLAEVGRGGMGVVYRATHRVLNRDVAVKVLRPCADARAEAELAARFRREAQVTGQLQHPGIPPVHELGTTPDGRPYMAMRLIHGDTLSALIARSAGDRGAVGRLVGYFEQVCQAVAFAHSRGVIHRDLKPSNVMVGTYGAVHVMDWGLAKILGDPEPAPGVEGAGAGPVPETDPLPDSRTQAGALLGTLAYMPPEQAGGEVERIDRRSDVFALGAVLCAILTGQPPYPGRNADVIRLMAIRGDTAGAFERLDGCGAEPELVALAKRCLASNRDDRPADAAAVAAVLATIRSSAEERARQAELDCVRAEAEREKAAQVAAAERKRRRTQGVLAVVVLVAAAAVGFGLWRLDQAAREREADRRAEQDNHRRAATLALEQAATALRKDNPAPGEVEAALAQAERRIRDGGLDDLRERSEGLAKDLAMLRRLDEIDTRRWTITAETRAADTGYARANYPLTFREYAIDPAAGPLDAVAEKVRRSPIAAPLTAALYRWLAVGGADRVPELLDLLDPDAGRRELRAAFATSNAARIAELVAKLDGRAVPADLAQFVGGHPLTPAADAARILTAAQGRHPHHFGLAIEAAGHYTFRDPDRVDERVGYYRIALAIRPDSTLAHNNLGNALQDRGDLDGAEAALREALRLDPTYSHGWVNLGSALHDRRDLDGAEVALREAIRLDPKLAPAHHNLGNLLRDKQDPDGAEAAFREALRLDPIQAATHNGLGNVFASRDDLAAAEAEYREAIRLDPNYAAPHNGLGVIRQKTDPAGALAEFREALRLKPSFAAPHHGIGNLLFVQGDLTGAEAEYRETIRLAPHRAPPYASLGNVLVARKDYRGAAEGFREAVRREPGNPDFRARLASALAKHGDVLARTDPRGAAAAYREVSRLHPTNPDAHLQLGQLLMGVADWDGAITEMRLAIRLGVDKAEVHNNLGAALYHKHDLRGAITEYRAAIRLAPDDPTAHDNLGEALRDSGDADGAIAAYREAARLQSPYATTYNELSRLLADRGQSAAALRVLEDGLRARPGLVAELRYNLARCACLVAAGRGTSLPPPVDAARLRREALARLTEELSTQRKHTAHPRGRPAVHAAVVRFLADPAFDTVRDPAALPADERDGWARLWDDARRLRDETTPPAHAPAPREKPRP